MFGNCTQEIELRCMSGGKPLGRDRPCPYGVILSRGEESCNALDEPKVSGKRVFKCPPDESSSLSAGFILALKSSGMTLGRNCRASRRAVWLAWSS